MLLRPPSLKPGSEVTNLMRIATVLDSDYETQCLPKKNVWWATVWNSYTDEFRKDLERRTINEDPISHCYHYTNKEMARPGSSIDQ